MKRVFTIFALVVALAALLACSVLAADYMQDYTTAIDGAVTCTLESGKVKNYTAGYTGTDLVEGNSYALLVVKGNAATGTYESISEDSILYIDQIDDCDGSSVSFANFIPMSTPDAVVLLGGEFTGGTSPKKLGTIVGQGVNVSGKVKSYDPKKAVSIQLLNGTTVVAETTIAAASSGSGEVTQEFTITSVPAGTYDLVVKKDAHLAYTVKNVVVGDSDLDLTVATTKAYSAISMLAGEIYGNDDLINIMDLFELIDDANYDLSTNVCANSLCDIDGDGLANIMDLFVVIDDKYYDKGVSDCTFDY